MVTMVRPSGRSRLLVLFLSFAAWNLAEFCCNFTVARATWETRQLPVSSYVVSRAEPETAEGGSVKLMLNAEERQQLMDLGYSEEEATEMRLELAMVVLERQTRRPWGDQPMPEAWRDEAIRQARLADLEAPKADSKGTKKTESEGSDSPDFSLIVGGTVVALLVLVAILVVVAGPAPPEGPTPSGYLPREGGYSSLPEYSLKS